MTSGFVNSRRDPPKKNPLPARGLGLEINDETRTVLSGLIDRLQQRRGLHRGRVEPAARLGRGGDRRCNQRVRPHSGRGPVPGRGRPVPGGLPHPRARGGRGSDHRPARP